MTLLAALVLVASTREGPTIARDPYGVPRIVAENDSDLYYGMGMAAAEDRLWQMENSRRIARGTMAEMVGRSALAADTETVKQGYTDEEYEEMLRQLEPAARNAHQRYADGVNAVIAKRRSAGSLPDGFAKAGIACEPWTVTDSLAIEVRMARLFGSGGGGELRNLALIEYLKSSPSKDRPLDVLDDLAWYDDPRSIPTASGKDDPLATVHPSFFRPDRRTTEAHLARVPKVSILELLPAIRASTGEEARLIALSVGAPFTTGSYCIVVSPERSRSGRPLLLTAPQMGHTIPAVVHEVTLDSPTTMVSGLAIPGVPGVVLGHTPWMAWGLTTGVADTGDVVFADWDGADTLTVDGGTAKIERFTRTVRVKDADPSQVTVERTADGPVLLKSRGAKTVFSLRTSYWKREVASFGAMLGLYSAKKPSDINASMSGSSVNFNLFFAFNSGETGWRYTGRLPRRAPGFDARLPIPAGKGAAWQGFLDPEQAPHMDSPPSGLIANWNNKPTAWWPNGDTPVWGRLFRNQALLESIPDGKLSTSDLERAAWEIARKDDTTMAHFLPYFLSCSDPEAAPALPWLRTFDGTRLDGSPGYLIYRLAVDALRRKLFLPKIGNLTGESLFVTAVQPSLIAEALDGHTRVPYLQGRKAQEFADEALVEAWKTIVERYGPFPVAWPTSSPAFPAPEGPPVPYSNRGTFIGVFELAGPTYGRTLCPPGASESGPHAADQVPLARAWTFKPAPTFDHFKK
ncbi:MAG: penicillin acylase family protein [Fimbriimonadaceae bacterium]|nr:penicillin acylase family protein [Fimbriimonadaceae bacterium]